MNSFFCVIACLLSLINLALLINSPVDNPWVVLLYIVCCFLASIFVFKNRDISFDSLNIVLSLFAFSFSSILFLFILST